MVLVAALVFWLGYDGGAYGLEVRTTLAIGVIWTAALAFVLGLWPVARLPRAALVAGALLAGFTAFTLVSTTWAASAEQAFAEFDRAALYLGVFALAALGASAVDRAWVADGIALGIVGVAVCALGARFFPHVVSAGDVTLLPTTHTRLSYPVNYWNGLGIMLALAYPLLLRTAVARSWAAAGAALAPLPALGAAIYLTSSRGGAATVIVGVAAFAVLCDRRTLALVALAATALGTLAAVAVLRHWPALVNPPLGHNAPGAQGRNAALLILLLCVVTGLAFALVRRYAGRMALDRRAGTMLAALIGVALVVGVVLAHPVRRFDEFKRAPGAVPGQIDFVQSHLLSTSGSGRWQFWSAALDEFDSRPAGGRGAGSYEAWWAAHGSLRAFVRNAHSLYLEVLGELGIVGLLLLAGAFLTALVAAVRLTKATRGTDRATGAALTASFFAFAAVAGVDWVWQVAAVSAVAVACLGLAAAGAGGGARPSLGRPVRIVAALAALALIVAQAIPLLGDVKIGDSQAAVRRGDTKAAIDAAVGARDLEPWAASPYLQLALVTEQAGNLRVAGEWIGEAIDRDRLDWRLWLVRSRIEAKQGQALAAKASLDRAVSLNPRSPLFSPERGR